MNFQSLFKPGRKKKKQKRKMIHVAPGIWYPEPRTKSEWLDYTGWLIVNRELIEEARW